MLTAMNSTPFRPASIMRFDRVDPAAADADDFDDGDVVLGGSGHVDPPGHNTRSAPAGWLSIAVKS